MNRKYYCKCGYCNHNTEFKNLNDSYIVCEECHRILNINSFDFIINGKGISKEDQSKVVDILNSRNKPKTILLEGDDTLDDFI